MLLLVFHPASTVQGGCISMVAFWVGGAAGPVTPAVGPNLLTIMGVG